MTILAENIVSKMQNSSWIRRMFEAGTELKSKYGSDKVYDFSLGNPDVPAPKEVGVALNDFAKHSSESFAFGYMQNIGFPQLRKKLAEQCSKEQGISLTENEIILSCGAAGALNALLRAIINPNEEMAGFSPYFVEYGSYISNHGGTFKAIPSLADTFKPDIENMKKAISEKTRAFIINSPHNPTGIVYSEEDLKAIVNVLKEKSEQYKKPIFLISDEPYRFLAYDDINVPSVLPLYDYAVVVSSFSKNLSLPGERLGYAILSPYMPEKSELISALSLTNRILGYVNPPVIGQQIMLRAMGATIDLNVYAKRRNAMAEVLTRTGYEFLMPKGAFYFFPKAPNGDDVAFVNALLEERILGVPGRGFGCEGYFRLAFCVDEEVIYNSESGFKKAREKF